MKQNKIIFKTDKSKRFDPKKELNILYWIFGIIVLLFIIVYFFSEDKYEILSGESKIAHLFFLVYLMRLILFKSWIEYYKETINYIYINVKLDTYIKSSLLNVLLDIFIILSFVFVIDFEGMPYYKFAFVTIVACLVIFLRYTFLILTEHIKKIYVQILFISIFIFTNLILFFGLPDFIFYSNKGFYFGLQALIILAFNTTIIYTILHSFDKNIMACIGIAALSVLIIGPSFGYWQSYKKENELLTHGVKTIGIVNTKWIKNSKSKNPKYSIQASFYVNDKEYFTSKFFLDENNYSKEDTISIVYSNRNPEINVPYWKLK